LKSAGHAAVPGAVREERAIDARCLGLGVSWRRHWFAVAHASSIQDVPSVRGLREVEAVLAALDVDTKEKVQVTQIFDGELRFEAAADVLV
jgi:hypothetical protein